MANRELVNYISSNLRRGVSFDDIQSALLARGHSDYDITEAVNFINGGGNRQRIQSAKVPGSRSTVGHGVKYFFLGFFCLVVLITIVLLLAPAIKDSQKNVVTISEGALKVGKSFDLTKNNLIEFEVNGEKNGFIVRPKGDKLIFSGTSAFDLNQGEVKGLDVNLDGEEDYVISYSPITKGKIFIQEVCVEKWECEEWDSCFAGTRKRACVDLNSCGTTSGRPAIVEKCDDETSGSGVSLSVVNSDSSDSLENEESKDLVVNEYTILSCGAGVLDDESKYCVGEKKTLKNETTTLTCCMGELVNKLELSDSLRSVWTSTSSSGECGGDLFDALHSCQVHKCLSKDGVYYRGVLGFAGVTEQDCAYIEERVNDEELYCEYTENDRANVVGYYFNEASSTNIVHNSSGTYLDGRLVRNYPQEAIDSGVCQII